MTADSEKETIIWRDGLPFSQTFGDFYYSKQDGREECRHVFLNGNQLPHRWQGREAFTIAELGFGTGLNMLETWSLWQQFRQEQQTLHLYSVEAHMMPLDTAKEALSRWPELSIFSYDLFQHWETLGNSTVWLDDQTSLTLFQMDAMAALSKLDVMVDAWFLDGFSPAANPDMWSEELMQLMADRTARNGTFASYTAAGWVRRNLMEAGFHVEKRPGFGKKRDMIVGHKVP